jgi:ribosomal protein S18 acetylase RimI-like enzyme
MGRAADPSGGGSAAALMVRPAAREDAHGLSELLGVLGYPCPPEEAAQRVMALRHDPEQTLLVATEGPAGRIVGLVCCDVSYYLPLGAPTCRITALAVSEDAQRHGVGRLLLREAELLARGAGAVRIELTSASHRLEAHEFYRRCGYEEGALRFIRRLGDA